MLFDVVSSTLTAWIVRASFHTLTYTVRPSGAKARNWGGPAGTGMRAVTALTAVSTTVITPDAPPATYTCRPLGEATANVGVGPTGIGVPNAGTGTLAAGVTAAGVAAAAAVDAGAAVSGAGVCGVDPSPRTP